MLEDWSYLDLAEGKHGADLGDLYYGPSVQDFPDLVAQVQGIADARAIILAGYNDCKPRRDLLNKLDSIEQSVQKQLAKQKAA